MCTVTYVPLKGNDFILTSSRDVPYERESAFPPQKYIEDGIALWYPKDGKAGGTWIGTSDKNRLICLLNGGFEDHTPRLQYRQSRGLIVKELLKDNDIYEAVIKINLEDIEQFTMVIVDWNTSLKAYEFVWNGSRKYFKELDNQPEIWSSSTLYDEKVKKLRKNWFKDWQQEKGLSQESILSFHHTAGIGDPKIDVVMDRVKGGTVSITSVKKEKNTISFLYEDLKNITSKTELLQYKCQE